MKEAYIHIVITRVSHWLTPQALQFACIWLAGEQKSVGVVHTGDYTDYKDAILKFSMNTIIQNSILSIYVSNFSFCSWLILEILYYILFGTKKLFDALVKVKYLTTSPIFFKVVLVIGLYLSRI